MKANGRNIECDHKHVWSPNHVACACPGCTERFEEGSLVISSHSLAISAEGTRYHQDATEEDVSGKQNLIVLCRNHQCLN